MVADPRRVPSGMEGRPMIWALYVFALAFLVLAAVIKRSDWFADPEDEERSTDPVCPGCGYCQRNDRSNQEDR